MSSLTLLKKLRSRSNNLQKEATPLSILLYLCGSVPLWRIRLSLLFLRFFGLSHDGLRELLDIAAALGDGLMQQGFGFIEQGEQ